MLVFSQTDYKDTISKIIDSKVHDSVKTKQLIDKAWGLVNTGEFKNAILILDQAIVLAEENKFKNQLARSFVYKGIAYRMQSDFKPSIECLSKGLALAEEIGNSRGQGTALSNLGIIYESQNNYPKAIEYYNRALMIRKRSGDKEGMIYSYNDIAILYDIQRDFKTSLAYFKKALELSQEIGDSARIAMCYGSMSSSYLNSGDLQKARECTEKWRSYSERMNDRENLSRAMTNFGIIDLKSGNYKGALENLQKGLAIAEEINLRDVVKDASIFIATTYSMTGDFKSAFEYQNKYIAVKDSILNSENSMQMNEMNAKYEAEKKDKLILQQQSESEKQKLIRNTFILGFAAVLVLMVFVYRGYRQKKKDNKIIQQQKAIVEEKQKEILDSINYAKRIQYTLLAHDEFLKENLPSHFIYFKPKDIVSGDFYWATKKGNKFYLAVCDSTGHGVPGAFMSLLNISFLNEAITERNIEKPNEIFDHVRSRLIENMSREGQRDGFDGVLLCMEKNPDGTLKATYSAANNNIILIREGKLIEKTRDKMPVGLGVSEQGFTLFDLELMKGDNLYLYTDGFADQFGGEKGKKFKYKKLNELLLSYCNADLQSQKQELSLVFDRWKGDLEQVDDVCVIGIRI